VSLFAILQIENVKTGCTGVGKGRFTGPCLRGLYVVSVHQGLYNRAVYQLE